MSGKEILGASDLFFFYVDVCNQAITSNARRFPFKEILGAVKKSSEQKKILVALEDASGLQSGEHFLLSMQDGELRAMPCNMPEKDEDAKWSLNLDYLKHVKENPDEYISNPAKINWDWMYDAFSKT